MIKDVERKDSQSVWEDSKMIYVGIAVAYSVIAALAVTIAVIHIQSLPKSEKKKAR